MRTNLKNITHVFALFAIACTSRKNNKDKAPSTAFRLTKDSTSIDIWGHKARLSADAPSDLLRGFGFYLMHIYSKNDSIYVSAFDGTYYYTTETWEEQGRWVAETDKRHNPLAGPRFGYQSSGDWQYLDSVNIVNWTPLDHLFDDYLSITNDGELVYLQKSKKKYKHDGDAPLIIAKWKLYIAKHDSTNTK
jgi:hypothetical protein